MIDPEAIVDRRRERVQPAPPDPLLAVPPAQRPGDRESCDRRMIALHRGDRQSIAQIAAAEGVSEAEVRAGIDRALHAEGCLLPDFERDRAVRPRLRWMQ